MDKKIVIEEGVTSIGVYAFINCDNLKTVILPASLSLIEQCSFYYCESLEKINLPINLLTVGNNAFRLCKNLKFTLPPNIQRIDDKAFGNIKKLTSITIPASVKQIGDQIFRKCWYLKEIHYKRGLKDAYKLGDKPTQSLSLIEKKGSETRNKPRNFYETLQIFIGACCHAYGSLRVQRNLSGKYARNERRSRQPFKSA